MADTDGGEIFEAEEVATLPHVAVIVLDMDDDNENAPPMPTDEQEVRPAAKRQRRDVNTQFQKNAVNSTLLPPPRHALVAVVPPPPPPPRNALMNWVPTLPASGPPHSQQRSPFQPRHTSTPLTKTKTTVASSSLLSLPTAPRDAVGIERLHPFPVLDPPTTGLTLSSLLALPLPPIRVTSKAIFVLPPLPRAIAEARHVISAADSRSSTSMSQRFGVPAQFDLATFVFGAAVFPFRIAFDAPEFGIVSAEPAHVAPSLQSFRLSSAAACSDTISLYAMVMRISLLKRVQRWEKHFDEHEQLRISVRAKVAAGVPMTFQDMDAESGAACKVSVSKNAVDISIKLIAGFYKHIDACTSYVEIVDRVLRRMSSPEIWQQQQQLYSHFTNGIPSVAQFGAALSSMHKRLTDASLTTKSETTLNGMFMNRVDRLLWMLLDVYQRFAKRKLVLELYQNMSDFSMYGLFESDLETDGNNMTNAKNVSKQ